MTRVDPLNQNIQIYVFYELRFLILIFWSAVEMGGSLDESDRINFSNLKIFKMFIYLFLARATSLYKSLFCPSVVRPSIVCVCVCKFFLGFWLVDNGNVTSLRRWISSTKGTYLLLQKYKTHNKRLSWAVPHSELHLTKIIPAFVVLALCMIKIDHIRARAIGHSVLFFYKAQFYNVLSFKALL